MGSFRDLKTVTFMLGCAEKGWFGHPSIELRDLEQWFADGRKRTVEVSGQRMDISELAGFMNSTGYRIAINAPPYPRKPFNIRVVTWKRRVEHASQVL